MGVKFAFYSKQAIRSLKSYLYLIIGIGLSISLILGIFNYLSASATFNVQNSFSTMLDFKITSKSPVNRTQIYDRFGGNETIITDELLNSGFPIESISHYAEFRSNDIYALNYSEFPLDLLLYDDAFIKSDRFHQYFTILEGRQPINNREYIIDAWTANKLNLTISSNATIPYVLRISDEPTLYSIPFENNSIVGIYVPNYEIYSPTGIYDYSCPRPYNPNYGNYEFLNSINASNPCGPIIGVFNYNLVNETHPINLFLNNIEKNFNISYIPFLYHYGLGIHYPRTLVKPFQLTEFLQKLSSEYLDFKKSISNSQNILVYSYFFSSLNSFSYDYKITRLSALALVIPIILFTIGLGNFIILTNFKNRQEEFGRYRIKGYPKNMIIGQIMFESFYVGIAAFILSIPLSIGIFYMIQPLVNSIFVIVSINQTFIPFQFEFVNFLTGFAFAIGISILGNILTIIKILRSKIATLNQKQEGVSLEIGYDENIFAESKKNKKKSKLSVYLDQTELMEKSIPKISYFLMGFAILPFLAIFIRYIGLLPSSPDNLKVIADVIDNVMTVILIFASLSPLLLVYGLLRFLIQESPSRFAKICKFLSKPFMKHHDYLTGLEMLRRKPYILVIFSIGLFTTSLVFGNINRYSQSKEMKFFNNLNAVSDINITINSSRSYFHQNISISDLNKYTSDLKSLNESSGKPIVENLVHLSFFNLYPEDVANEPYYYVYGRSNLLATNLSSYSSIIHPDIMKKFPLIEKTIENLQNFRSNVNCDTIGVIVNQEFLDRYSLKVGETSIFSSTFNGMNSTFLNCTIVDVIDFLPAVPASTFPHDYIWHFSMGVEHQEIRETPIMLCDFGDLNINDTFFTPNVFSTLVRTNSQIVSKQDEIEAQLSTVVEDFSECIQIEREINIIHYEFFDSSWNDENVNDFEYDPLIVLNLLYLNLIIIGILLAFAIATTIIGIEKSNTHFEGLLLSRGFGKKRLFNFIFSQIIIIFLFSLVVGGIGAALTGWTWMEAYFATQTHYSWYGANIAKMIQFPVDFNPWEIFSIVGIDFCLTAILYGIFFILQERKSISRLLIKF